MSPVASLDLMVDDPATATLTAQTCYSWGADLTIVVTVAGNLKVVVAAYDFPQIKKEIVTKADGQSIFFYGRQEYTLPDNYLIQTNDIADTIATALLASYKDPTKDVELDWRGNPALMLGNIIKTFEYVKGLVDVRALFWSVKQTFKFDGTLRATLTGRKIPGSDTNIIQDVYTTGEGTIQDVYTTGEGTIQDIGS
jgi:hypothetical protein